ncbi:MAG: aminoacyltransferase, partial [Oscillochloris sp.]|nr:aminoacyltransferase [Oscillochloris sp.]
MLICRILGNLDPASALGQRWEELVQASPACGVMQSLSWAAFKHRQGLRTLHLGVFIHGDLIGGALCYAPPEGLGAGLLVAPEGPLLPWEQHDLARAALRAILEAAEQAAAVYGALALR